MALWKYVSILVCLVIMVNLNTATAAATSWSFQQMTYAGVVSSGYKECMVVSADRTSATGTVVYLNDNYSSSFWATYTYTAQLNFLNDPGRLDRTLTITSFSSQNTGPVSDGDLMRILQQNIGGSAQKGISMYTDTLQTQWQTCYNSAGLISRATNYQTIAGPVINTTWYKGSLTTSCTATLPVSGANRMSTSAMLLTFITVAGAIIALLF